MIFHFQTGDVTFFDEDKEYFQKRLFPLKKLLGWESGDDDTVDVQVKIAKNKHHTGDKFESSVTILAPNGGKFHANVSADTIRKCVDMAQEKIKVQIAKFHGKKK
ncbi:HPF/RaiA family ribosome-associated protein [Candidatus Gracilibacteria bacterium]|nr:HPF/RaiA family ribosome-associated protein [Candidatus Gracilibacteria bacterium]